MTPKEAGRRKQPSRDRSKSTVKPGAYKQKIF